MNPDSFKYDQYYDGFHEKTTMAASNLPLLDFKRKKEEKIKDRKLL